MEIIIEYSLAVSLFLNYLILKITSKVTARKGRLLFLSALLGALFNLVEPIFNIGVLLKICLTICEMVIVILISFKYKNLKDYFVLFAVLLLTTFLFGGACCALEQAVGQFPLFVVAVVGAGIYIIAYFLHKVVTHSFRVKKFTYNLTFKDGDKIIREEGYLDSGNVLYDTITNKPIVLVNYDVFHKLYENISFFAVFTKKIDSKKIKNGHYLNIKGVGKGTNILVFTIDELQIEGKENPFKNVSLGLSFSGFEKSFGKNVLLHCDYS